MARYLRDLSIHLTTGQDLPVNKTQRDFNITTHQVQNIFLYMIPNRFELGDILKLNISVRGINQEPEVFKNYGGYANYSFVGIDFDEYFKSSILHRNEKILNILREIILIIPDVHEENRKIALDIIDRIREIGFDYIHTSKKLSKYNRSRNRKAEVYYRVNDEGHKCYLKIIDKQNNELFHDFILENTVFEFYTLLNKSKWNGDTFQIYDRNGTLFYECTT